MQIESKAKRLIVLEKLCSFAFVYFNNTLGESIDFVFLLYWLRLDR